MGSLKLGLDDRGLITSSVPGEEAKYQMGPLWAPTVLPIPSEGSGAYRVSTY